MKITFDKKADALVISFMDGRVSRDTKLSANVFAGYNREGNLVEIQVLEASKADQPWLTLEATAALLGKSTRTLLRWIETGKVSPKKVGRDYRFLPEMVQKLSGDASPIARRHVAKRK